MYMYLFSSHRYTCTGTHLACMVVKQTDHNFRDVIEERWHRASPASWARGKLRFAFTILYKVSNLAFVYNAINVLGWCSVTNNVIVMFRKRRLRTQ